MDERRNAPESSGVWIRETQTLILRTIGCLAREGAESGDPRIVRVVRDLADHASIWSELAVLEAIDRRGVGDAPAVAGISPDLESWMFIARAAGALAARFERTPSDLLPDARRAAICCLADVDTHLGIATELLRNAERRGFGQELRDAWCRLPSRLEFAPSSCLHDPGEASSAA